MKLYSLPIYGIYKYSHTHTNSIDNSFLTLNLTFFKRVSNKVKFLSQQRTTNLYHSIMPIHHIFLVAHQSFFQDEQS